MKLNAKKVGIEMGGTFTDLVAFTDTGVVVRKVLSTPHAPDRGIISALKGAGVDLTACTDLVHGSTVATNAILERKGARVAFVTTRGFRDVLFLQRHDRSDIYDLKYKKPVPIVEREACFEVGERMLPDGRIQTELDEEDVCKNLIPALRAGEYNAVALCLLNAYANPVHEMRIAQLLNERLPSAKVTRSMDVSLEFREYERASTTALSAYVQPVIDSYLNHLEKNLTQEGFTGCLSIMQSNGARLPASGMRQNAISALFSGPAAGVVGAYKQVGKSGFKNIITLDIGGTSSDVCIVDDGKPLLTRDFKIDGLPVRIPMISIVTTGAGGGSLVRRDEGGMLRVGPESAGADPGPACYGRGGVLPTVTDAHVVRGTIQPGAVLGGVLPLQPDKARAVFSPLADTFELSVEAMADNAIRLANFNIVRAVQLTSTELGKDPRDYALVAFGGGGPLHAAQVADALDIETVVVPPNAGVVSAFGLAVSDVELHDNATRCIPLTGHASTRVAECLAEARERLRASFATMSLSGPFKEELVLDMRYAGQAFDIPVSVSASSSYADAELIERFIEAYRTMYFHVPSGDLPVEIIGVNLTMSVPVTEVPALAEKSKTGGTRRSVRMFIDRHWHEATACTRAALEVNETLAGPLLIEDITSTILVPAEWTVTSDENANLVLRKEKKS